MVREAPSWVHTLKTVLQSNLKAVFLFFDADYRQQSCFEVTPLKQVLHNFLLNSTQNRNKYVTEIFAC